MDDLENKVIQLIAENQQIEAEKITIDSTFEDLGVDSFDGVNLLFAIESEFELSVSDEQAKQLRSVREMVDGVRSMLAEKQAGATADVPA
jgi:acyl carrier protein